LRIAFNVRHTSRHLAGRYDACWFAALGGIRAIGACAPFGRQCACTCGFCYAFCRCGTYMSAQNALLCLFWYLGLPVAVHTSVLLALGDLVSRRMTPNAPAGCGTYDHHHASHHPASSFWLFMPACPIFLRFAHLSNLCGRRGKYTFLLLTFITVRWRTGAFCFEMSGSAALEKEAALRTARPRLRWFVLVWFWF